MRKGSVPTAAPGGADGAGGPRPRRLGGLLRQRSFRLLWIGETISQLGSAMAVVGVPLIAVIVLHASTFAVAVLTAAAWLPWLVIGMPAGAWVDRLPARRVMIGCDVVAALLYASVPAAAWAGVLTIGMVIGVQLTAGGASVLFATAYQVYLPSIVGPGQLVKGNTTMQGSASAAMFAGPGLAGAVAQLFGAVTALFANALSFVASAACLLGARPAGPAAPPVPAAAQQPSPAAGARAGRAPDRRTTLRQETIAGFLLVVRDPLLRQLSVYWAVANLALTGYGALLVVFLVRVVGLGPGPVGLLTALPGAGGIAGALVTRRVAARYGTARGLLLSTLGMVPCALLIPLTGPGPRLAFYGAGALVAFAGIGVGNIIIAAFRQSYSPPGMCGRVTATMRFLIFGTSPLGALLAGGLGSWLGVRNALWMLLGLAAAAGALLLTPSLTASRDLPARPARQPAVPRTK